MGDLDKSLFELSRAISKSSLQPFYKRDLPCSSREVKQKFWKNDVFFGGGGKRGLQTSKSLVMTQRSSSMVRRFSIGRT